MGKRLKKLATVSSENRTQKIKSFNVKIENQGEVKRFLMHLPIGTKRVKCMLIFAQDPKSRIPINSLIQENGFEILQEDGNIILTE